MKHQQSLDADSDQPEDGLELPEPASLILPMAVDIRSVSLALLTLLAVIYMLHWARAIFIPLMLGVMISYTLNPLVSLLRKWRFPRVIGAAVLLLAIMGGTGALVYSLGDDAIKLIETLPDAAHKFRTASFNKQGKSDGAMESMQKAASQLEKAASESVSPPPAAPRGVTRVQVEKPQLAIKDYLWMGTKGAVGFAGQVLIVLFLAYFMLASGDTFRRKLVKIAGPTLSKKKITLRVLDQIANQVQNYLLVQILTSVLVALATWLAFLWLGLEHAALWGIAAGLFKIMPYLGPVIITAGTAVTAFLQFESIDMALLVSGTSLLITSLEGYLLTPWLTSRASRMSPVVVFVSVLFWGWLWGVWGLLLGVPITMIIKAVCDHVEDLETVGELLGD